MALDLTTLIDEIEAAYDSAESNPGAGNRSLAESIGAAFDKYTKTAQVNVPALGIKDSLSAPCTGSSNTGSLT